MKMFAAVALGVVLGGAVYVAGTANITVEARGIGDASAPALQGASAVMADVPAAAHAVDAAACGRLTSLKLSDAAITSAEVVEAGKFEPPTGTKEGFSDLPTFCRVQMTIKPSNDSDIKSEIWLPVSGWNGKFQEVGNGGWNGFIQYAALAGAVRRGYAAASTDTGHVGDTAKFAVGHPEKLIDFGYRAVHETAVQGKATISALYGSAPRFSYFTGCSGGGRQAFMEAQRYPEDFEGIIAGDPGYDRAAESVQLIAATQATHKDAASLIPREKFAVLHQAALDACDALDGINDGIINNPLKCKFDPGVTLCKGADGPNCLTAAQVEAAKKLYAPIVDERTGKEIFPGFEPGTELRFANNTVDRPLGMAEETLKYTVMQDPNWDYRTLEIGKDTERARNMDKGVVSATSTNLKPYVGRGGKLIIYHGWADQNVAPLSSVNYYNALIQALGKKVVEDSVRLYMAPGMGHCAGGEGPSVFDVLTPVEQWKEHGIAPREVIASQIVDGKVIRTRPLCPYPQESVYKGGGSTDEAQNFVCKLQ
jgi:feruloyl esterase